METTWRPVLIAETEKPYWKPLQQFVRDERTKYKVFPPDKEVFAALHLTPYEEVKVLILGQDPYHEQGQAQGLCFSVRPDVTIPPSLVNIYKELHDDLGCNIPQQRQPDALGRAGRLATECRVNGESASSQLACGQGLGKLHRRDHPRDQRQIRSRRLRPVGRIRAQEETADRRIAARGHRIGASVAAVGQQRVLRQPAVLQDQCGAARSGQAGDRLANP